MILNYLQSHLQPLWRRDALLRLLHLGGQHGFRRPGYRRHYRGVRQVGAFPGNENFRQKAIKKFRGFSGHEADGLSEKLLPELKPF